MVYVYLADGFEEIEAVTVIDVLRRANVAVRTVSVMKDLTVTGAHDVPAVADTLFEDAPLEGCEMMILPGGGPGTARLLAHAGLTQALSDFAGRGGRVAAICAAPMILARNGLLDGREATIYAGMEDELARARYREADVVEDGPFVTSRGAGTALPFALRLAAILAGEAVARDVGEKMLADSTR